MKKRVFLGGVAVASLIWLGATGKRSVPIAWEDLTERDPLFEVETRKAEIDGRNIHYETPTAELLALLLQRADSESRRRLADVQREAGDWPAAEATMSAWSAAEGPEAHAEAARWAARYRRWKLAFSEAELAVKTLPAPEAKPVAAERIAWAERHPEHLSPLDAIRARAELDPGDAAAWETLIRAYESAGRLADAEKALSKATALSPERRWIVAADLKADHGDRPGAYRLLLERATAPRGHDFEAAFARRADVSGRAEAAAWRETLEAKHDAAALERLSMLFRGRGRGDQAADLLRQVERRFETGFGRTEWLQESRLWLAIDGAPEAFRARLAAAAMAASDEQRNEDLAELASIALRAGSRPLSWGVFNNEPYRWVARLDTTPGFWTGGLSFLLTGQNWNEALAELEARSLPDRVFGVAQAIERELARRSPGHRRRPELALLLMQAHLERGEGKAALARLPIAEKGDASTVASGREKALAAMQQVKVPLPEELTAWKARLKALAPDGSRPEPPPDASYRAEAAPSIEEEMSETPEGEGETEGGETSAPSLSVKTRSLATAETANPYWSALEEGLARMDERDKTHKSALSIVLTELDRLPEAEALWRMLTDRLGSWNLDDDLGPRYEAAVRRFSGAGWWNRLARWYARRQRHDELRRLAEEIATAFRGAEIFARAEIPEEDEVLVGMPERPGAGGRVPMVAFRDFVALKALERFPQSRLVVSEARRLVRESAWGEYDESRRSASREVTVSDRLMDMREAAVLFVDQPSRQGWLVAKLVRGELPALLAALEKHSSRTPPEDQLLAEGHELMSRFEKAVAPRDRLARAYPGNGDFAHAALTLHRSLAPLDPSHAEAAAAVVRAAAPALEDDRALVTELGETFAALDRLDRAAEIWKPLSQEEPRDPARIAEYAALLWDYGLFREALAAIEEGRKRVGRPRLLAFEAGVLREELKDLEGALWEYRDGVAEQQGAKEGEWLTYGGCGSDASQRLARLLARERVRGIVSRRVASLAPGDPAGERELLLWLNVAYFCTAPEDPWDDWVDRERAPNDPVGRELVRDAREKARPQEQIGIEQLQAQLSRKTREMIPRAASVEFLENLRPFEEKLLPLENREEARTDFQDSVNARTAELASTPEARIAALFSRANLLGERGRKEKAGEVRRELSGLVTALPEGGTRISYEVQLAGLAEKLGADSASDWQKLSEKYFWSLGVLNERIWFERRRGRRDAALAVLEAATKIAGRGRREELLGRLASNSLEANDLPTARRAVESLLSTDLPPEKRVSAVALSARLAWRGDPGLDALPRLKQEEAKLPAEWRASLYAEAARAAEREGRFASAVPLWIEALNRLTERGWIAEAARAGRKAGKPGTLLEFFERQQKRSPRDVRWAVAVRELRVDAGDLPGAIEAARTVCFVRPEKEVYWQEAVTLFERALRFEEAGDFLKTWHAERLADEGVATWRARLYLRAGKLSKATGVVRESIAAYRKASPGEDGVRESAERLARAARFFLFEAGEPEAAWSFACPGGRLDRLAEVPLSEGERARLALATGRFVKLLAARSGVKGFLEESASEMAANARPEAKEEIETYLIGRLFPSAAGGDARALNLFYSWWQNADLRAMPLLIARKMIAGRPGPWGSPAGAEFEDDVAARAIELVPRSLPERWRFARVDFEELWVRDLTRRDRPGELAFFLQPRLDELVQLATTDTAVKGALPWTKWLTDTDALKTWMRGVALYPEKSSAIASLFSDRRRFQRFLLATGGKWEMTPILEAVPENARAAYFERARELERPAISRWEEFVAGLARLLASGKMPVAPAPPDPIEAARRRSEERVASALSRLLAGEPGAASDPTIGKLRGPRTVGEVLGTDPRWLWGEFAPRAGRTESAEDLISGKGPDSGRFPGRLWGETPALPWHVLEALSLLRERKSQAAYVPLEASARGEESRRTLLAVRLAQASGDPGLALLLDEEFFADLSDPSRLSRRLSLLRAGSQASGAAALWQQEIRRQQVTVTVEKLRQWWRIAEDLQLPRPEEVFDPAAPLSPGAMAELADRGGPRAVAAFRPSDEAQYRTALALKWEGRWRDLDAERLRFALQALWAHGHSRPDALSLRRIGRWWGEASDFLVEAESRFPDPKVRREALAAVETLPATERLTAMLSTRRMAGDGSRHLLLKAILAAGRDGEAQAMAKELLASMETPVEPLRWAHETTRPARDEEEEEGEGEESEEEQTENAPVSVTPGVFDEVRLSAWYAIFRQAGKENLVANVFLERVRREFEQGRAAVSLWKLAYGLSLEDRARRQIAKDMDLAWIRGELGEYAVPDIVKMFARDLPEEARRWYPRLAGDWSLGSIKTRVQLLRLVKDRAAAAQFWTEARRRTLWDNSVELEAFDSWKRGAPASSPGAPAAWIAARGFEKEDPAAIASWSARLSARLDAHPEDILSPRVAARSLSPASPDLMARAARQLPAEPGDASSVLAWRSARFDFGRGSWRAAERRANGVSLPSAIEFAVRKKVPPAEIDAALADLTRIGHAAKNQWRLEAALQLLETRNAGRAATLRSELRAPKPDPESRVGPVQSSNGQIRAWRPRDLTWAVLDQVLAAEGVR